jgi:hypothetical protein
VETAEWGIPVTPRSLLLSLARLGFDTEAVADAYMTWRENKNAEARQQLSGDPAREFEIDILHHIDLECGLDFEEMDEEERLEVVIE